VVADENLSPDEEDLLARANIPVLAGVPGVFTAFSSGDFVKIDVKRGIYISNTGHHRQYIVVSREK
jgi:phosphohistidine swiveling domain-containing protein